ncbi:hypothetical protein [Massilia suwonensis]|uniref:Immunity protein 26 of polymorphic toxin system n=1 Tax=Massilia suwonensis TaxID=648895 RepID=A0ABW0MRA2_9BURK
MASSLQDFRSVAMESRKRTISAKIGDIYVVECAGGDRYFQYVMDDSSQLGANVIAVFAKKFPKGQSVDFLALKGESVEFFAHVSISLGIKMKCWRRVTHEQVADHGAIRFRDTDDYGKPGVTCSNYWWMWEPNGPARQVGPIEGELRKSFIGVLMAPSNIVSRLETGRYSYAYPVPAGDGEYWE